MKRSLFTTATALLFCLSLASAALAYTEAELDFLFQYGEYQRHIGTPDYLADISAKGNLEVAHTTCLNLDNGIDQQETQIQYNARIASWYPTDTSSTQENNGNRLLQIAERSNVREAIRLAPYTICPQHR